MNPQKLKLFVWTRFCPDYTPGLAFAIAHNETEAKKLIEKEREYAIYDWGKLNIYQLNKHFAISVTGGG